MAEVRAELTFDTSKGTVQVKQFVDKTIDGLEKVEDTSKKTGKEFKDSFSAATVAAGNLIANFVTSAVGSFSQLTGAISDNTKEFRQNLALVENLGAPIDAVKTAIQGFDPVLGKSQDLLEGYFAVFSGGVTDTDASLGLLKNAAELAFAENADLTDVVKAGTKIWNIYGKEIGDTSRVFEILSATAQIGDTNLASISSTIARALPSAKALGIGIEQVAGTLAILTQVSGSTEQAVTNLDALMRSLAKDTPDAAKAAKDIGAEWGGAALAAKGMAGFVGDLKDALDRSGKSTAEQAKVIFKLTGEASAAQALIALLGDSFEKLGPAIDQVSESAGIVGQKFDAMKEAIGPVVAIENAFNNLLVTIGETAVDELGKFLEAVTGTSEISSEAIQKAFDEIGDSITGVIEKFNEFVAIPIAQNIDLIVFAAKTLIALQIGKWIRDIVIEAQFAAGSLIKLGTALKGFGAAAVAILAIDLVAFMFDLTSQINAALNPTEDMVDSLERLREEMSGLTTDEINRQIADFENLIRSIQVGIDRAGDAATSTTVILGGMNETVGEARARQDKLIEKIEILEAELKKLGKTGKDVTEVFDNNDKTIKAVVSTYDKLQKKAGKALGLIKADIKELGAQKALEFHLDDIFKLEAQYKQLGKVVPDQFQLIIEAAEKVRLDQMEQELKDLNTQVSLLEARVFSIKKELQEFEDSIRQGAEAAGNFEVQLEKAKEPAFDLGRALRNIGDAALKMSSNIRDVGKLIAGLGEGSEKIQLLASAFEDAADAVDKFAEAQASIEAGDFGISTFVPILGGIKAAVAGFDSLFKSIFGITGEMIEATGKLAELLSKQLLAFLGLSEEFGKGDIADIIKDVEEAVEDLGITIEEVTLKAKDFNDAIINAFEDFRKRQKLKIEIRTEFIGEIIPKTGLEQFEEQEDAINRAQDRLKDFLKTGTQDLAGDALQAKRLENLERFKDIQRSVNVAFADGKVTLAELNRLSAGMTREEKALFTELLNERQIRKDIADEEKARERRITAFQDITKKVGDIFKDGVVTTREIKQAIKGMSDEEENLFFKLLKQRQERKAQKAIRKELRKQQKEAKKGQDQITKAVNRTIIQTGVWNNHLRQSVKLAKQLNILLGGTGETPDFFNGGGSNDGNVIIPPPSTGLPTPQLPPTQTGNFRNAPINLVINSDNPDSFKRWIANGEGKRVIREAANQARADSAGVN